MAQKVLTTEKQLKKHFSKFLKPEVLDDFVRRYMSEETLFPEKVRRAKERLAQMDPELLDSILNRKK